MSIDIVTSTHRGQVSDLEHFVWAGLNAWRHVAGIKSQLLHLCEVVDRVSVKDHLSHWDQRVLLVRPDLVIK